MKQKIFGKNIEPACKYCSFGRANAESERVFCRKRGIVDSNANCRSFDYDPLKRIPVRIFRTAELEKKDFNL